MASGTDEDGARAAKRAEWVASQLAHQPPATSHTKKREQARRRQVICFTFPKYNFLLMIPSVRRARTLRLAHSPLAEGGESASVGTYGSSAGGPYHLYFLGRVSHAGIIALSCE
jgi:hypothetical protein